MTPRPEVTPLPYGRRKYLFIALFLIFVCLLPVFIFYATGYRFDLDGDTNNIVSTGGIYVASPDADVQIFLDEELITNFRFFRNAAYIQNLSEGVHRLNVQGEGLQTWTKDVAVYPHIVTEAESFNLPEVPQVRLITPYSTIDGSSVVFVATTSEVILPHASTTNEFYVATTSATSTFVENPEYTFVAALFGTTSTSSVSLVDRVVSEVETAFNFATEAGTTSTTTATTTKQLHDVELFVKGEDVYARWRGGIDSIPYYYCVDHVSAELTILRYGEHVYAAIAPILASSTSERILMQNDRLRVCRDEIRIDRKWQNVLDFDFFPNSADLVLMVLADGVYVVEVDDRSWQNTELLYSGANLRMVVDGGRIYVFDGERYFEVFTELQG